MPRARGRRRGCLITPSHSPVTAPPALFPPLLSASPPLPLLSSDGSASPTTAPSSDPRRRAHGQDPRALGDRAPELEQVPGVGAASAVPHLPSTGPMC